MFDWFKRSSFIKKVYVTMAGSLMSQIIVLAVSPVITRIYGPDSFGVFSNIAAISAVLVSLLTLSFSLVVVLPGKLNNALALTKFTVIQATCITFVLFLAGAGLDTDLNIGDVSFYWLILFAYLLSIFEILTFWLLRIESFSLRAKLLVMQAFLVSLLKVVVGYFYPNENSLLYATMIGLLFVIISIYFYSKVSLLVTRKEFLRGYLTAKKYVDIAKYRTPQNLLANFNLLLPILMLTYMYSPEVAGMYALARTVLLLPGNLIAKSIGDVLFPKLNRMYNAGLELSQVVVKAVCLLFFIGLLPLFTVFFYGEQLFSFVFGDAWQSAGSYARWLSIWLYISFLNKPCVTLIPILRLEKVFLKNSILNSILTTLGLWLGFYFYNDANYSIALFCFLTIVPQLFIVLVTCKKVAAHDKSLKKIKS